VGGEIGKPGDREIGVGKPGGQEAGKLGNPGAREQGDLETGELRRYGMQQKKSGSKARLFRGDSNV